MKLPLAQKDIVGSDVPSKSIERRTTKKGSRENVFTKDEILDILKACRDTGVRQFTSDAFSASFDIPDKREVPETRLSQLPPQWGDWRLENQTNAPSTPPAPIPAEPDHEKQTKDALEIDELRSREEQLAELLITDPEAAEEMLTRGELGADERGNLEEA